MKTKVTLILSITAILTVLISVSSLAGVTPLGNPALQSGAPSVVSYQGQVTVGGSAYNGSGYFKFAVVNAAGDSTYWSNDGTSVDGKEPTKGIPLPVSNGLFNVLLGDTSLINMTQPLSASVFSGTNRYLRVWFSEDDSSYQLLSPDRRIAAVPYALQAQEAVNADTVDGQDASDLALPSGVMVLSNSNNDTTLISAGFTYTGHTLFNSWTTKADMPTKRSGMAVAVVNGVIYAIGGISSDGYETKNEAYDPFANSWTTKNPLPTGRVGLAAAAVDGVIYAIGGWSYSVLYENKNEAYDPVTNTWTTRQNMPTGRHALAAVAVDGVIYAIGGYSSTNQYETKNEAYNPAGDSWRIREPMTTGRRYLAAAAVDGVIYAVGGGSSTNVYEDANEAYDPDTNAWRTLDNMTTGRFGLTAAVLDGVIYAIGGRSALVDYETKNEVYNPATNRWSSNQGMNTGRVHLAAAAIDGVIYVIGGESSTGLPVSTTEAYTPAFYVYSKD
jgi:N-acetylneuraminic acid mutarotase